MSRSITAGSATNALHRRQEAKQGDDDHSRQARLGRSSGDLPFDACLSCAKLLSARTLFCQLTRIAKTCNAFARHLKSRLRRCTNRLSHPAGGIGIHAIVIVIVGLLASYVAPRATSRKSGTCSARLSTTPVPQLCTHPFNSSFPGGLDIAVVLPGGGYFLGTSDIWGLDNNPGGDSNSQGFVLSITVESSKGAKADLLEVGTGLRSRERVATRTRVSEGAERFSNTDVCIGVKAIL